MKNNKSYECWMLSALQENTTFDIVKAVVTVYSALHSKRTKIIVIAMIITMIKLMK